MSFLLGETWKCQFLYQSYIWSVWSVIPIIIDESEASVRLESGDISIYPIFQKENLTELRIIEIYVHKDSYDSHLQTPHFKHLKQ